MIVLNMGIPRSGTVWAFNVFRGIFETLDLPYRTCNANSPADVDAALNSAISAAGAISPAGAVSAAEPDDNLIVHFHDLTGRVEQVAASPDAALFFNYRDPRDIVVSQMKLHGVGFPMAVRMTMEAFRALLAVTKMPGAMLIPYPHIGPHAEALIFQMGLRLGYLLDLVSVRAIAQRTSAARHQQLMKRVDGSAEQDVRSAFTGQRWIRYDESTLVTDRHIQSGKDGRFKDELSPSQQTEVNRIFADVIDWLGFDAATEAPQTTSVA